ncbi:MAG TPA: class F sortase [Amycolatopsis sp.]|nr:class F sortase [Amycolatopsis sp.]
MRWPVVVAVAFAALSVVFAAAILFPRVQQADPLPAAASPSLATAEPVTGKAEPGLGPSNPASLEIPVIGVRTTRFTQLGLTQDGELEVPGDATTVGWFTGAPTPGQTGPAVLAAHVDYHHLPGVFFRLKELRAGAQVLVRRADGRTVVFTVYRADRYPKTSFPTDQVYGDTTRPELRLITCGGVFDRSSGNYLDNVVVYARLTSVEP